MTDLGDYYKEQRSRNKAQRERQRETFQAKLDRWCLEYTKHSDAHYTISTKRGPVDYWPGTARWRARGGKTRCGWGAFLTWADIRADDGSADV